MKDIIAWLENNKEWAFSGIGLSALGLMGALAKRFLSRDKGKSLEISVAQNPSVTQAPVVNTSPAVTQAPVVNITNTVVRAGNPQPHANGTRCVIQAPLFALNPLAVTRDLIRVAGSSSDDVVECCVARFKMHDGVAG